MITGELKNKIDSLWDIFAAGGLVNPLDVIEQITYLMFIHDLDDSDNLRAKEAAMLGLPYQSIFADEVQLGERTIDGQQLKWSVFHDFVGHCFRVASVAIVYRELFRVIIVARVPEFERRVAGVYLDGLENKPVVGIVGFVVVVSQESNAVACHREPSRADTDFPVAGVFVEVK